LDYFEVYLKFMRYFKTFIIYVTISHVTQDDVLLNQWICGTLPGNYWSTDNMTLVVTIIVFK
jgi:hypothetical protein